MNNLGLRLQLAGIGLILFGGFVLIDPSSTLMGIEILAMLLGSMFVLGGLFYKG